MLPLALSIPLVVVAGFVAGVINTVVGSGSLVTYPVLVLAGVPPVGANITNTVGLAPGAVAGAVAFRRELAQQRAAVVRLLPTSVVGAVAGAALLRVLPASAFPYVVPVLILFATALVAFQPAIARRARGSEGRTRWIALIACVLLASVYGGYFSAAQGIILLAILGVFLEGAIAEQNALKNLLQATVNVVAAIFFLVAGGADLLLAACVAVGSLAGAPVGAVVARRVPARVFRVALVCFGLVVAVVMVVRLVWS